MRNRGITMFLHDFQKFDDYFRNWSDNDLFLSGFLSVQDGS